MPYCGCDLETFAAEEVDELDDEDDDHGELEEEGAALVELIDHEAVEIFGGIDFLLDEVLVIGNAYLGGSEAIETRCEHVAEELDGVVGVLGEFHDLKQYGMEAVGGAGLAKTREEARALLEGVIDGVEYGCQQLVVVAKFEKLRVSVFEKLNGGFGAGGGVVEEGGVPADDGEVGGIVRDAGLEDLVALVGGEGKSVSANDLRDERAVPLDELGRIGGAGDVLHVDDEVVLGEPLGVGFDQRRVSHGKALPDDLFRLRREVDLPGPATCAGDQLLPGGREGELKDDADDAVVVVLDFAGETLTAFEHQRSGGFDDGRALVTDVSGGGMFEGRLLEGGGAEKSAQVLKVNLFAHIELQQSVDGSGENGGFGCGLGGIQHPLKG